MTILLIFGSKISFIACGLLDLVSPSARYSSVGTKNNLLAFSKTFACFNATCLVDLVNSIVPSGPLRPANTADLLSHNNGPSGISFPIKNSKANLGPMSS